MKPDPPINESRRRWWWSAVVLLAVVVLVACGPDRSSDEAATGTNDEAAAGERDAASSVSDQDAAILDFYRCLRDNGLDVSDPRAGGGIDLGGADPNDPAVQAAVEDCRGNLSESGRITFGDMGQNMADTASLLTFVDCMRGHGIDIADPGPDGRLSLPEGLDPSSADFRTATQDCAPHLGGGGIIMGSPDGEGGMVTRGSP